MFSKKKFKEQLPDGDERKRYIDYPIRYTLAEMLKYITDGYSDLCYLKASEEYRVSHSKEMENLKNEIRQKDRRIENLESLNNRFAEMNGFLMKCLKEKYDDGLFVVSNAKISHNGSPLLIIQNGKNLAENARSVDISWEYDSCNPEINIDYSVVDFDSSK